MMAITTVNSTAELVEKLQIFAGCGARCRSRRSHASSVCSLYERWRNRFLDGGPRGDEAALVHAGYGGDNRRTQGRAPACKRHPVRSYDEATVRGSQQAVQDTKLRRTKPISCSSTSPQSSTISLTRRAAPF